HPHHPASACQHPQPLTSPQTTLVGGPLKPRFGLSGDILNGLEIWGHRDLLAGRRILFMSPDVSELLKKALALPPEARAALAGALLESLDDAVDPSVEEAWKQEIARRMEELDSGKVKPIPWAEARRQITALLNGR